MATLLYKRHVARGWDQNTMRGYILDADRKIRDRECTPRVDPHPASLPVTPTDNKDEIYIHVEYHPNDISRREIRSIYDSNCHELFSDLLGITKTTIAYSRPENIQELVTKAKLHQAPGRPASKYYTGELSA